MTDPWTAWLAALLLVLTLANELMFFVYAWFGDE